MRSPMTGPEFRRQTQSRVCVAFKSGSPSRRKITNPSTCANVGEKSGATRPNRIKCHTNATFVFQGPGPQRGRTGSGACRWILGNAAPGSPHVGGEKASNAPGSGHVCGNGSPQAPNATDMTRVRCASRSVGTDMPSIRCIPGEIHGRAAIMPEVVGHVPIKDCRGKGRPATKRPLPLGLSYCESRSERTK